MSQIILDPICSVKCVFIKFLLSGQKSSCPWNVPYPRKTPIITYRSTASSWDPATIRTIPRRNREACWLLKANRKPERSSVREPWLIGRWFIYLYIFFFHAYARAGGDVYPKIYSTPVHQASEFIYRRSIRLIRVLVSTLIKCTQRILLRCSKFRQNSTTTRILLQDALKINWIKH